MICFITDITDSKAVNKTTEKVTMDFYRYLPTECPFAKLVIIGWDIFTGIGDRFHRILWRLLRSSHRDAEVKEKKKFCPCIGNNLSNVYLYQKILFIDVAIPVRKYEKRINSKSGLHQIQLILNSVKMTNLWKKSNMPSHKAAKSMVIWK